MKRDLLYRCTLAILILVGLATLAIAGPGCGASRKIVIGDAKNAPAALAAALVEARKLVAAVMALHPPSR